MGTRYNIGDKVIWNEKKTYIKDVLGVGKPTLYVLPLINSKKDNITVLASELKKPVKCKVMGCNKKAYCKGLCQAHYYRQMKGQPLNRKCLFCDKLLPIGKDKFCNPSHRLKYHYHQNIDYFREKSVKYMKKNRVEFQFLSRRITINTHGYARQIKQSNFVNKEKERILNDCIKNPARYLYSDKKSRKD